MFIMTINLIRDKYTIKETIRGYLDVPNRRRCASVNKMFQNLVQTFDLQMGKDCFVFSKYLDQMKAWVERGVKPEKFSSGLIFPFIKKLKINAPLDPRTHSILTNYLPEIFPNINEITGDMSLSRAVEQALTAQGDTIRARYGLVARLCQMLKDWPNVEEMSTMNDADHSALDLVMDDRLKE